MQRIEERMSLRAKAAQSLIWTLLESGGLSILSFVTLVVVARLITPGELGVVTIAIGIIQLLTLPVEMLFHDALVQRDQVSDAHFDAAFTISMLIAATLCLTCFLTSGVVARLIEAPSAGPMISVLGLSLIASGLGGTLVARNRREFRFRALTLRSLAGRLAGSLIGIVAAIWGAGAWSLVLQQLTMVACSTLLLWITTPVCPRLRLRFGRARELLGFGLASLCNQLLVVAEQRVYAFLVALAFGPATAGYLNLAFRVTDMPRDVMAGSAHQLALPLFRSMGGNISALRNAFNEAVSFTCAISFPLFTALAVCAPEVVELVFGERWLPASPFVSLLAVLTIAFFPKLYSGALLSSLGVPQLFTPVLLAGVTTCWIGMATVGQWSIEWAATVWALRLACAVPIEVVLTRRITGMSVADQYRGVWVPLAASAAMAAGMLAARYALDPKSPAFLQLTLASAAGVCIYPAVVLLLDRAILTRLLDFVRLARARGRT
jgi:O-antigen/teichoic acid export membrane protein